MLRVVQTFGKPFSYPADPVATYQPGLFGQVRRDLENDPVLGVSDGTAPLGLIDEIKGSQQNLHTEHITVPLKPGAIVELSHPYVVPESFHALAKGLELHAKNGVVQVSQEFCDGFDPAYHEHPVAVRVSYRYTIPYAAEEDTTLYSGKCTIWTCPGIYKTDQYDGSARFELNAAVYVDNQGRLTPHKEGKKPSVGVCMRPPTAKDPTLEFYFTGPAGSEVVAETTYAERPAFNSQPIAVAGSVITSSSVQDALNDMSVDRTLLKRAADRVAVHEADIQSLKTEIFAMKGAMAKLLQHKSDADRQVEQEFEELENEMMAHAATKIQEAPSKSTTIGDFAMPLLAAVAVGALLGPQTVAKEAHERALA